MKSITFVNWTKEEFTWKWDNEEYSFPAGKEIMLPEYQAHHFAKHLVNRELTKMGKQVIDGRRDEFLARCLGEEMVSKSENKREVDLMNKKKVVVEEVKKTYPISQRKKLRK